MAGGAPADAPAGADTPDAPDAPVAMRQASGSSERGQMLDNPLLEKHGSAASTTSAATSEPELKTTASKRRSLVVLGKVGEGLERAGAAAGNLGLKALDKFGDIVDHSADTFVEHVESMGAVVAYKVENMLAADPYAKSKLLSIVTVLALVVSGTFFYISEEVCERNEGRERNEDDGVCFIVGDGGWFDAVFNTWLIYGGGEVNEITEESQKWAHSVQLICGMFIFALLVSFITNSLEMKMEEMNQGRSTVVDRNHTVVLGWNNSTARVVKEFALVRKKWLMQNESLSRRLLPWLRTPPATSVACNRIVVMACTESKQEMEDRIRDTLESNGISPKRTMVGREVIVRVGDPRLSADLRRVGVHNALAVVLMMTGRDEDERERSGGFVYNGATTRTLLALRSVLSTSRQAVARGLSARVVVQLDEASPYVDAACWESEKGDKVVFPITIRPATLLFSCALQPGLARVLLSLMTFDGVAFRALAVERLGGGALVGRTFAEARRMVTGGVLAGLVPGACKAWSSGSDLSEESVLAPADSAVLRVGDRLIVLAENSSPAVARALPPEEAALLRDGGGVRTALERSMRPRVSLVCGWREWWVDDRKAFLKLLSDEGESLPKGSLLIFFTRAPVDVFAEAFEDEGAGDWEVDPEPHPAAAGGEARASWRSKETGLRVAHVPGDAAVTDDVCPVLEAVAGHLDTVVVLSTQHGEGVIGEDVRDSRVLGLSLQLRYQLNRLAPGTSTHLVTEIAEDEVGRLLLPPRAGSRSARPDYVNLHAMKARILAQVLAFPELDLVWRELFSADGCEMYVCDAALLAPLGVAASFAQLSEAVRAQQPTATLVGWRKAADAECVLAPGAAARVTLEEGDALMIIAMESPAHHAASSGRGGVPRKLSCGPAT